MKCDGSPTHPVQLRQCAGVVTRFADLLAIKRRDLIGADDQRARIVCCDLLCLLPSQAQSGLVR